jgi:hypothetical protein
MSVLGSLDVRVWSLFRTSDPLYIVYAICGILMTYSVTCRSTITSVKTPSASTENVRKPLLRGSTGIFILTRKIPGFYLSFDFATADTVL